MNDIKIYNKGEGQYVIDILGDIGEDFWGESKNTKQAINDKVKEITAINADEVVVNISSLGGSVDHGLAIHDALASLKANVITNVTGLTASAATIIAQAGNVRRISENALYLIHRAWTVVGGNTEDLLSMASDLEKIDERILNIYKKKSDASEEELKAIMAKDQFLSPDEALALGLVDEIYEPAVKAAASVNKDHLSKIVALGAKLPEEYNSGLIQEEVSASAEQVSPSGNEQQESTNVEAQALETERERLNLQIQAEKLKQQILNEVIR